MSQPPEQDPYKDHDDYGREGIPTGEMTPLTDEEVKARRGRNYAIAGGVVLFIALIYATTYFRFLEALKAGTLG